MSGDQLQFGDDERSLALRRAWDRALHLLIQKVNKVTFESYIRPIKPLGFHDREVTLGVPSPFAREWLDGRYRTLIADALAEVLDCRVTPRFQVLAAAERNTPVEKPEPTAKSEPAATVRCPGPGRSAPRPRASAIPSLPLNTRYTFDNFVVGKCNRLAQAAATAVATSPGKAYNPLFLYGGPGLGKTHLLHAVAHAATAADPDMRVALIDGEGFTYHYVSGLRERKTEEFRSHFRSIDFWLVDDIQFIAGREQTKEEFFHTFNTLYQTGRQIVIASDRSPRELRSMDERLRSRFECGLVADITTPELETRMAILERRARSEGWQIPTEVIYYIAGSIQSNIRALEGALTKLVAYSSIMRAPISIDLAQSVLSEYLIEKPLPGHNLKGVTMETILGAVADQFGTTIDAIRGTRRDRPVIVARQAAMCLCRELTGSGLAQIGQVLGGRDHTTVQRGIARMESQMVGDADLRKAMDEARSRLER